MVVTATGLVFVTAKDGRMRAFDADNGDEVWNYKMPAGLIGLPSMYEVQGRQYLVVGSGPAPVFGIRRGGGGGGFNGSGGDTTNQGYMVFALPKK
jgi:quinoprotein glucose dehydrogenase